MYVQGPRDKQINYSDLYGLCENTWVGYCTRTRFFLMNNVQLYTEESTLPELIMNATVTLFGEANNLNQNAKVQKYLILLIELSP